MATVEPAWLSHARTYDGLREIVGPKHNATIMAKIKVLGVQRLGIIVNDDEAPWCGTFMAWVMLECGFEPPKIAVRASSWDKWGQPSQAVVGAVARFQRPSGGHVGLIIGERLATASEPAAFRIFGGNQSNKAGETWIEKSRLVATRWPLGVPASGRRLLLASDGEPLSRNEA